MKSYRKELWFNLPTRRGFINITPQVEQCLRESGIQEGIVLINPLHITASVFINDDEPGLHKDYDAWLERLAPHAPTAQYRHNDTGEDNADAHLKRQVMGREVVVAITQASSISEPGNKFFTVNSTARGRNGCWSKSSANDIPAGYYSVAILRLFYTKVLMDTVLHGGIDGYS
jgi:Uncharacterized conserved protein